MDYAMRLEATADIVSIVLLGAFNPKIFHPAWLAMHGLISPEQADDADVVIVHSDITKFTAAYMTLDINSGRFVIRCDTIHKDVIRDLVLAAFGEHLPHTPVWQLGINRSISFSCGSDDIRNKFGALLAPKIPWGPWGSELEQSMNEDGHHGGMIRLIMRQLPRPDGLSGHIQADIRPEPGERSNVVADINNHFAIRDADETIGSVDAMEILFDRWQASMEGAENIVDGLMATMEDLK